MGIFILMRFILSLFGLIILQGVVLAASGDIGACMVARNPQACSSACKPKDEKCQADWHQNDAEATRRLLEAARLSDEGYEEICKKLALRLDREICKKCPEKTKECALKVLELEADWYSERAFSARELIRMEELRKNPRYTNESLKKFDPRKPVDRRLHPEYNAIGFVQLPGSATSTFNDGTGWLANDCLVFTARHVITGASYEDKEKSPIGKRVKFLVGNPPAEDKNFAYKSEGTVVAAGEIGRLVQQDWALIKLDKSLGKHVGKINAWQYSVEDALTCVSLEVAGYPGGKAIDRLWWQTNCPLEKYVSSKYQFIVGCPATPGNSGGPLLCRETDGDLRAIGIVATQSYGANAQALNFTADWFENIKPAYHKYKDTCPKE